MGPSMAGRPRHVRANTLTFFRLAGFEVRVDLTWLILFALIVWSLASGAFPGAYPGLSHAGYWSMGLAGAAALFLSIILHELAHAKVARRYGLQVRVDHAFHLRRRRGSAGGTSLTRAPR